MEAALILPVIIILTFGCIEFGIGFSEKGGLESIVRSGARIAATESGQDNATAGAPYSAPHTQIGYDAMLAVQSALGSSSLPELGDLFVYRIDGSTGQTSAGTATVTNGADCSDDCIQFHYDGTQFQYVGGSWPKDPVQGNRNVCVLHADKVGVTVTGTFHFITGLFGNNGVDMTESSILQLEPTIC